MATGRLNRPGAEEVGIAPRAVLLPRVGLALRANLGVRRRANSVGAWLPAPSSTMNRAPHLGLPCGIAAPTLPRCQHSLLLTKFTGHKRTSVLSIYKRAFRRYVTPGILRGPSPFLGRGLHPVSPLWSTAFRSGRTDARSRPHRPEFEARSAAEIGAAQGGLTQ